MQSTDAEIFYPGTSSSESSEPSTAPDSEFKTDAQIFYPAAAHDERETVVQVHEGAGEKPAEYQLAMPEGVTIDPDLLTAAAPVFQELGLTSEQASKLVPLAQQVQERLWSSMTAHHNEVRTAWKNEARADSTIGGTNWNDSLVLARNALDIGGAGPGSEVRKLLNDTGLGDHPAFIRMFRNLGMRLGSTTGPKTAADIFYPRQSRGA